MRSAGHAVRLGDVLTIALDRAVRVVEVAGFADRRGGALAARALYRDLTSPSGAEAREPAGDSPRVQSRKE